MGLLAGTPVVADTHDRAHERIEHRSLFSCGRAGGVRGETEVPITCTLRSYTPGARRSLRPPPLLGDLIIPAGTALAGGPPDRSHRAGLPQ
ncbi:MAG: hypothetical protein ACYDED_14345 [Ferrimicrobium sp.]